MELHSTSATGGGSELFEEYYRGCSICSDGEWDELKRVLQLPLPVTFRTSVFRHGQMLVPAGCEPVAWLPFEGVFQLPMGKSTLKAEVKAKAGGSGLSRDPRAVCGAELDLTLLARCVAKLLWRELLRADPARDAPSIIGERELLRKRLPAQPTPPLPDGGRHWH